MPFPNGGSVVDLIHKKIQKQPPNSTNKPNNHAAYNTKSHPTFIIPQLRDSHNQAKRTAPNFYGTSKNSKTCEFCLESGHIVYDSSSGDELCRQCGRILESRVMSEEKEWRIFSLENTGSKSIERNRVGEAIDPWLDDGVSGTTMIGGSKRLRQILEVPTPPNNADKLLRSSFQKIKLITEAFSMKENITEIAKEITKELQEMGQLKNRDNIVSMLAVVYIACREADYTRKIEELVIYDRSISEKELGSAINRLKKLLPHRGPTLSETAAQNLPRLCSRLNLSINIADTAEHITQRSSNFIHTSHRPSILAAGAILLTVHLSGGPNNTLPSSAKISEVTGASEHTMKAVCKELLDVAEYLLPKDFKPSCEGGIEGLRFKMGTKRKPQIENV